MDVKFAACQEQTLLAGEVWVAGDVPSTEAVDEGESKTNCFSQGLINQVYWQIAVWSGSDLILKEAGPAFYRHSIYKMTIISVFIGMDNNSLCCLPTPMTLASGGGESDVPACGLPASFSVHLGQQV